MPTDNKTSQRDEALIKILGRLIDQLKQYDTKLEEISKDVKQNNRRMEDISKKHNDLTETVRRVVTQNESRNTMQQDMDTSTIEKLTETMHNYRSDMLSMVREQDRIDDGITELSKRQDMIAAAQEEIGSDVAGLDERFELQEKTAREHYEFAVKQGEEASREIAKLHADTEKYLGDEHTEIKKQLTDADHKNTELHLETEKHLGEDHREIQKQLADADHKNTELHLETEKHLGDEHKEIRREVIELRQETKRRLLSLDGIEASLEVLMIRTEPPEKKPFFLIRAFKAVIKLFRVKIPDLLSSIRTRLRRKKDDEQGE